MDLKLEIEFQADVLNGINNKYVVTTKAKEYKNIIGEGTSVSEAIDDFDEKCKQLVKCA